MKKRLLSVLIIMMLVLGTFTTFSAAASSKTMTGYSQVVKSGNTAFAVARGQLFKVNLKKGTKKAIAVGDKIGMMKIHRGYLYYLNIMATFGDDDYDIEYLYRVNIKKGSPKKLGSSYNNYDINDSAWHFKYALTKTRIYYNDKKGSKLVKKSMKLNGTNKKSSKIKVINKTKKSNAKGYSVYRKDTIDFETESGSVIYYLKKPGKDIKLVEYTYEDLYGDEM